MKQRIRFILFSCLSLLPLSCVTLGPDYARPEMITPDAWNQRVVGDLRSSDDALDQWWRRYEDVALNRLIDRARQGNLNLQSVAERVIQARSLRQQTVSPLFPTVVGGGDVTRSRSSEHTGLPPGAGGQRIDFWSGGFDVAWEIDFFGALRRGVEVARANEAAAEEQYRDALVSLDAETTLAFLELRTTEQRMEIFSRNLGLQKESLDLAKNRFDSGLVPEIDVTQAQANLENTRASLPTLRQQRTTLISRLAVLVGVYPADVEKLVGSGAIPLPKRSTGIGLPADLLRLRPDVRAAERLLAAQNARIGVAKGDLYPRLSLNGSFNLETTNSGNLLESASRSYGFGPALRLNLFNAGFVRNEVAIQESKTREGALRYRNTVLNAVADVETNLAAVNNERDRLNSLEQVVTSAQRTVELIKGNYADGLVNFQNVLDSQRVLLQAENDRAASRGLIAAGYARLYKSLGGGVSASPQH